MNTEPEFKNKENEEDEKEKQSPEPWSWDEYNLIDGNGKTIIETDSGFYKPNAPNVCLLTAAPKMRNLLLKINKILTGKHAGCWVEIGQIMSTQGMLDEIKPFLNLEK